MTTPSDPEATDDAPSRADQLGQEGSDDPTREREVTAARKIRPVEVVFCVLTLLILAGLIVWFVRYTARSNGASKVNAVFAAGLVIMGALLLGWSYVRRPPEGQDDDFLDKLLSGAGQALLLGAVLTFGFGIVNQRLEAERATTAARQNYSQAVRDAAGGKDFRGLDLTGQSFGGLDLHGFNFAGARLGGAHLGGATLSGADLIGADLSDAIVGVANLSGADLTGANLRNASLVGPDEVGAANLSNARLIGADLRGADLLGVNLSGADLTGANLIHTPMEVVNLSGANLNNVRLNGAYLSSADLSGAIVGGDLSGADLTGANLSGANLFGANLSGVTLTGVIYDQATVWPDYFKPPPSAPPPR